MHVCINTYMQAHSRRQHAVLPSIYSPAHPAPCPRQLLRVFLQLLPMADLLKLPSLSGKRFYQRIFCPVVTLWYFIFQRIQPDHSLDCVLSDAHAGGADALRPHLSEKLNSTATASYSDARKRLPLAFLRDALALQAPRILALDPAASWRGFAVGLLDGTTLRLRSLGDIPKRFPPHYNQHNTPAYWCLPRVMISICAFTGTVLDCILARSTSSEQEMASRMILRQRQRPGAHLWVGDRNFGVFRIAQAAIRTGSHVLLRMTRARALKLLGGPLVPGDHPVLWSHSRLDKLQSGLPADPIPGRLLALQIQRDGFRTQELYLFTTLTQAELYPPLELGSLYARRWHVELNLRYIKAQMNMEQLECKSAEMAAKEWFAGLLAYNLIRASMLCAALRANVPVLRLCFSSSRRHLVNWLALWSRNLKNGSAHWEKLLDLIARCRLPNRSKPRPHEPRAQRHPRPAFPPLVGSRSDAREKLNRTVLES